jgi:D-3-phosphoglycerate dehydrogenase
MTLTSARSLSKCHVLVTPTSFGARDPGLRKELEAAVGRVTYNSTGRPLPSLEVRSLIGDVDGYIAGLDEVDEAVMVSAPRLRVIARYGVGLDRVDLVAATARGIVVTNTPGANSGAVAELAIALMLALARRLPQACAEAREGGWPRVEGVAIEGKTVGLVGLGAIGQAVALRLAGFGCCLLASDPWVGPDVAERLHVRLVDLDELLPASDVVSLHAPLLPSTSRMVNGEFLARVKPGAFLINTARGELVDEQALLDALRRGRLRGAALDCFSQEPPEKNNPLLSLPQVIVTPHTGSHTDEAVNRMGRMALQDCLAVLAGRRPAHPANPSVYEPGVTP